MDNKKTVDSLIYSPDSIPPAQLWVGNSAHLFKELIQYLQKFLCQHNGCTVCNTCTQISQKQHHAIKWFFPDKSYTIEQLENLFTIITFQLPQSTHFFFIIEKADTLNSACANKLLKPMEDPPFGYHFILLTTNEKLILPTVTSRCVTYFFTTTENTVSHKELFESLTTHPKNPTEFSLLLDASPINDHNSIELLDAVFNYWTKQYKNSIETTQKENSNITYVISTLKQAYTQLPMPGSSTIFWRNIYLQINDTLTLIQIQPK